MLRSLLTTLTVLLPLSGYAGIQQLPSVTYNGINFAVPNASTVGYPSTCDALDLVANGDISGTGRFQIYGVFNCAGTNEAYALSGSGYLTDAATINLNLNVGIYLWTCSLSNSTLSGSCTVVNFSGTTEGTITLNYQP
jgi:hypothetical protein